MINYYGEEIWRQLCSIFKQIEKIKRKQKMYSKVNKCRKKVSENKFLTTKSKTSLNLIKKRGEKVIFHKLKMMLEQKEKKKRLKFQLNVLIMAKRKNFIILHRVFSSSCFLFVLSAHLFSCFKKLMCKWNDTS